MTTTFYIINYILILIFLVFLVIFGCDPDCCGPGSEGDLCCRPGSELRFSFADLDPAEMRRVRPGPDPQNWSLEPRKRFLFE